MSYSKHFSSPNIIVSPLISLSMALLAFGAIPAEARAAIIIADGTNCKLTNAIIAANTDARAGGCRRGRGADTIVLGYNATLAAVNNTVDGLNGLPSITSNITINGNGHAIKRSSVTDTPFFRLLHVGRSGRLTLNAVSLQNGRAARGTLPGFGRDNGGALFNRGIVKLVKSTVSGNVAIDGYGIMNGGTITLDRSTISNNFGPGGLDGAGLYNYGTARLIDSTVSGNYVGSHGGGIFNTGGIVLTDSTISSNGSDTFGGGLYNLGTATLINSTVFGNFNGGGGGGISNGGTITLAHTTVSGNRSSTGSPGGGGLYNTGTVKLINSLFADNTGGDCNDDGVLTASGVNLIEDGSCGSSFPADTDPMLGPLMNNGGPTKTQALIAGSPAIDQIAFIRGVGCANTTITTDERGMRRPQPAREGMCDIGAFEVVRQIANQPANR